MKNATVNTFDLTAARTELHELLQLTSCEVSCNNLPAGAAIPFVHKHQQNEETYIVLQGAGEFYLDGEIVKVHSGSVLRIDPPCERCIKAGPEGLRYLCIQARQGSLAQYTMTDGVMCETKAFS